MIYDYMTNEEVTRELRKLSLSDLVAGRKYVSEHMEQTDYTLSMRYAFANEINKRLSNLFPYKSGKMKWQFKTKTNPVWTDCTDEIYEQIKHLARFEFQQVEI